MSIYIYIYIYNNRECIRCQLLKSALFYEQYEIKEYSNEYFIELINNNINNNNNILESFISYLTSLPSGYIKSDTIIRINQMYLYYYIYSYYRLFDSSIFNQKVKKDELKKKCNLYIQIYRFFLHTVSQTPILFLNYFENHELASFINFNYKLANIINNDIINHLISEIYILLGKYYIQLEISQSDLIKIYHSYFIHLSNNLSDFNILIHIDNIIYNILITYTIRSKNENDKNDTLNFDNSLTTVFSKISQLLSSGKIDSKSNELYYIIMNWFYLYQFIIKSENTNIKYENENERINISKIIPNNINEVIYSYIQSNCISLYIFIYR